MVERCRVVQTPFGFCQIEVSIARCSNENARFLLLKRLSAGNAMVYSTTSILRLSHSHVFRYRIAAAAAAPKALLMHPKGCWPHCCSLILPSCKQQGNKVLRGLAGKDETAPVAYGERNQEGVFHGRNPILVWV